MDFLIAVMIAVSGPRTHRIQSGQLWCAATPLLPVLHLTTGNKLLRQGRSGCLCQRAPMCRADRIAAPGIRRKLGINCRVDVLIGAHQKASEFESGSGAPPPCLHTGSESASKVQPLYAAVVSALTELGGTLPSVPRATAR